MPIIVALTVILPIGGSNPVSSALISREGSSRSVRGGRRDLRASSSSALAIAAAFAGAGAWSRRDPSQCVLWIVKGGLAVSGVGLSPLLRLPAQLAWPYLGFGLNALGANLADFANKNLPTLIIGGIIGVAAAGRVLNGPPDRARARVDRLRPLYLSIFASVAQWSDDRRGTTPLALRGLRGIVTVARAVVLRQLALIAHLAVVAAVWTGQSADGADPDGNRPGSFSASGFIGAIFMGIGDPNTSSG